MTSPVRFASVRSRCRRLALYSAVLCFAVLSRLIPNFRFWIEEQFWYWSLHPADRMLKHARISHDQIHKLR